jgi:hypothetical protein
VESELGRDSRSEDLSTSAIGNSGSDACATVESELGRDSGSEDFSTSAISNSGSNAGATVESELGGDSRPSFRDMSFTEFSIGFPDSVLGSTSSLVGTSGTGGMESTLYFMVCNHPNQNAVDSHNLQKQLILPQLIGLESNYSNYCHFPKPR